jgi:hypothetical protein
VNLREALAAKRVREAVYPLAVEDDAEPRKRLEEARARRILAGIGKDPEEEALAAARAEEAAAQADVDACYHPLRLRGLSAADMEALRQACPPKPGEADGDEFDEDLFRPGLIAACAVDSDLSAEEWAEELTSDRWTLGDVATLYRLALEVCRKPANDGLGKG